MNKTPSATVAAALTDDGDHGGTLGGAGDVGGDTAVRARHLGRHAGHRQCTHVTRLRQLLLERRLQLRVLSVDTPHTLAVRLRNHRPHYR